jgi:exodeoxyribonuclease VII small subunit
MSSEPSFEAAQAELERIVGQLESDRVELEEALVLWQRGEELYRTCLATLDAAQGKIEELGKRVEEAQP